MAAQNPGTIRLISIAASAILTGVALPAEAQSQKNRVTPLQEPTSTVQSGSSTKQLQQFTTIFRSGLTQGCLKNSPKDLVNPRKYCSCYANAFVNRYAPEDLLTIEQRANTPESASLIGLMMSPEIRACKTQN
jgi:hypothetical protein